MTTEERAREISESFYRPETGYNDEHLYISAMAMAEWKDEQHEKILTKFIVELDELKHQEKLLLLKHLCSILPYGVKYCREFLDYEQDQEMCAVGTLENIDKDGYINGTKVYTVWDIKPYLRPLSSMTDEEKCQFRKFVDWTYDCNWKSNTIEGLLNGNWIISQYAIELFDFLNKKMFDYRGLIEKGLAIEAPDGMYEIAVTSI